MSSVKAHGSYLEHNEGGHFKFYTAIYSDDGTLVLHWGRLGSAGQFQLKQGAQAKRIAQQKIAEKVSRGYELKVDDLEFSLSSTDIEWAVEKNEPKRLAVRFDQARTQPIFAGEKDTVVAIYEAFLEQAQSLMDRATKGGELEPIMDDFNNLRDVWQEIEDKHSLTATTLGTTKLMLAKAMMGVPL